MSLALVENFEIEPTLGELAVTALTEHRQAMDLTISAVEHAIGCGEALIKARLRVDPGEWRAWCAENVGEIDFRTLQVYCRLARYREHLAPSIASGEISSVKSARKALIGVGGRGEIFIQRMVRLDVSDETLRELRTQGLTYQQIAAEVGMAENSIRRRLNPELRAKIKAGNRRRSREIYAARKMAAERQLVEAVRQRGGLPAEAYALLRRCAVVVDRAIADAHDGEERRMLTTALSHVHLAEDSIVRALRLERQR